MFNNYRVKRKLLKTEDKCKYVISQVDILIESSICKRFMMVEKNTIQENFETCFIFNRSSLCIVAVSVRVSTR